MNEMKWKTEKSTAKLYIKLCEEMGEVAERFLQATEAIGEGEKATAAHRLDQMAEECAHVQFIAEQLGLRVNQERVRYELEIVHGS